MKFLNKLQNKRILIFGGTSGLGYAVAEGAVEFGAHVTVSGSNQERLNKTVERLKGSYPDVPNNRIGTYACDLSDADTLELNIKTLLINVTSDGKEKLDHIVFTAGDTPPMNPVSSADIKAFRQSGVVRVLEQIMI